MKDNQLVSEVRWDRVPLVAGNQDAGAWLGFQACRGLALNTLDAYGRNLERYLRFLGVLSREPQDVKQETAGSYLRDLTNASGTGAGPDVRMANATIQQHLATLRISMASWWKRSTVQGIDSGSLQVIRRGRWSRESMRSRRFRLRKTGAGFLPRRLKSRFAAV
jgi:hypothetical protein